MRRQFEIYQLGLAGKKLSVPIPLAQLEKKAAEVLTPPAYDYVAGGASGGLVFAAEAISGLEVATVESRFFCGGWNDFSAAVIFAARS